VDWVRIGCNTSAGDQEESYRRSPGANSLFDGDTKTNFSFLLPTFVIKTEQKLKIYGAPNHLRYVKDIPIPGASVLSSHLSTYNLRTLRLSNQAIRIKFYYATSRNVTFLTLIFAYGLIMIVHRKVAAAVTTRAYD